jgi:DNA polymerase-3 subunit chi
MAQVDFYLLTAAGEAARQHFACRLAEKAYRLDNRVHIHVGDVDAVRRIDDLLWTFRDGSFVPHEVFGEAAGAPEAPITISCNALPDPAVDLLINLADSVPENAESFPRVAEVVSSDSDCKTLSRQRFVAYRDQGHTLDTHNL